MKRKRRNLARRLPEPDFLPEPERGRWRDSYVREVFFLSLLGATDVQMSQVFGVSPKTIELWKRVKPEFRQSMQKGKIVADAKVSNSLFLAATGYCHDDEVIVPNRVKEFKDGKLVKEHTEVLRVKTTKNYPPNVTAAIKWLQARQPEVWGNKVEVRGNVNVQHKVDLSGFSLQELKVLNKLGIGASAVDTEYEEV